MTIGRRLLRVEDRSLLTGTAMFVDDIDLPGMLHARFLRSPAAHAEVLGIELDAARSVSGVRGVFAEEDLGLAPLLPPIESSDAHTPARPLLARSRVRFVGEPLAVVVADSPYAAEDGADAIELRLRPLPVAGDPLDSEPPAALHSPKTNVLFESRSEAGEIAEAFTRAATVVEREFRSPRQCATPIEPRGAVAADDGEGIRIWSSTQAPHALARATAELLALPLDQVRVTVPDIGGGFGQKAHTYPEEIVVAWLARHVGRPVKWVEDRSENLAASSHARDQVVWARAAADEQGRLVAVEVDVTCDTGAYGVYPHGHILEALGTPAMVPGPYRLDRLRARARSVATNKCPEGAYRGVGLPVSTFVHERLMDVLAGELRIDRAEIRRRNLIGPKELPFTTVTHQRYDSGDYRMALERALDAVGYEEFADEQQRARRQGRALGLGIACYVEYTGMGSAVFHSRGMVGIAGVDRAWLSLDGDGTVTVMTTLPSIGQGLATTFAQLAADQIGVGPESIRVRQPDTAKGAGTGTGTFASRTAIVGGGSIKAAATDLRDRLLQAASDLLEVAVEDLELRAGAVGVRGSPGRQVSFAELATTDPARYQVEAAFDPDTTAYPYATHACIVEVEPVTGAVKLERYVVAEDCGRIINPLIVEGQAHGAVAQGVGGALYEAIVYDAEGQLLTASLMDYLMPVASDLASLEVEHLQIPAPGTPNGAKGVGEGGTLAPGPAIANAVSDALQIEINELPLTPERVRRAAAQSPVIRHDGM